MMNMNTTEATKLAQAAVETVTVGNPEPVADTTVLFLNADGTYSVTDNGEEVVCKTASRAVEIIVENLTAAYGNE
jgi:hypothetical protein